MKLIRLPLVLVLLLAAFSGYSQAVPVRNDTGAPLTNQTAIINKYSKLLSVDPDSIKNIRLYSLIEQFSGAPYKFGGNDPSGVDCSGFSCAVEKWVYNKTIPRSTAQQANAINSKNISDLKEGDLVFLKLGGSTVNHVGVYLQNGFFVHATSNLGLVLDNLNTADIQQRFMSCGSVNTN